MVATVKPVTKSDTTLRLRATLRPERALAKVDCTMAAVWPERWKRWITMTAKLRWGLKPSTMA